MSRMKAIAKRLPGARPTVALLRSGAQAAARTGRRVLGLCDASRIRALRNVHRGRRCWVIGNGPSLTGQDLSLLAGEVTFASNCFFLLFEKLNWRPTYYLVEDHLVAEDNAGTINGLRDTLKIFPRDLRSVLPPGESTTHVEFVRGEYPGFPRFSHRCDRMVYWGGTVTYMMLQVAAWMGCNPIYLIGTDLTYNVPTHVDGDEITSCGPDMNHFHPDYFGPGKRWHDPRVDTMQRCFNHAYEVLRRRGVALYNATQGGKLEDLPRARYEDVLGKHGPAPRFIGAG